MDHPAMDAYKDAAFQRGKVFIKAGVSTRFLPMDTRRIMVDGVETTFALLNTRAVWLQKCVGGTGQASKSSLYHSGLLNELHELVHKYRDG